jgi:hypothetical protein
VLDAGVYEALLYWKLYSQPAALHNLGEWFAGEHRTDIARRFRSLGLMLPPSLSRAWTDIRRVLDILNQVQLPGMRSPSALPVRTTLLHFLYPTAVPIFDKMVLKAVGMWSDGANTRLDVLKAYLPVAWRLADRYESQLVSFRESSVRVIDMGLWVTRGDV